MTVQRADTFTRANQTGWGTASDGNTWTIQSGNGQSIASNEGLISGSTASTFATLGASLPGGDAEGLVRWDINNGSSTSGIILRWTNANNFYLARFDGAGHIAFYKKVAGTATTVGSYAFTNANATFYWTRFRAQGTTISIRTWTDGSAEPSTWNYTVTDTSLAGTGGSANYVGLYGYGYSPGNNYDSFSVDDLASGTAISYTDAGAGADALASLSATLPLTDSGAGAESFALASVAVALSDAGAGADALASLNVAVPLVESGAGVDALQVTLSVPLADAGAATDALSLAPIAVSVTDVGAGVDAFSGAQVSLTLADTGAGLDTLALNTFPVTLADIGGGVDALSMAPIALTLSDVGGGADAVILAPIALALADAGVGASALAVVGATQPGVVTLADASRASVTLADALLASGSVTLADAALGSVTLSDAA